MSDRTINFGESETEATYQIQDTDSTGGGNFVVAKDTNANTVLLQYDPDTDSWEYAADVDMNGGNVSAVGSLTADSVNTEKATIGRLSSDRYVHADDFDTLQEANDFADNEGLGGVYAPGDYDSVVATVNIVGHPLEPCRVSGGPDDVALTIEGGTRFAYISSDVDDSSTDIAAINNNTVNLWQCRFAGDADNAIVVNEDEVDITNCKFRSFQFDGDDIVLNGDQCLVDSIGLRNTGQTPTIVDNGSGNRIGDVV